MVTLIVNKVDMCQYLEEIEVMEKQLSGEGKKRKHFIFFVHGVTERTGCYADKLKSRIHKLTEKRSVGANRVLMRSLTWYDIPELRETNLTERLQKSCSWGWQWLTIFREGMLLRFVGDATVYVGANCELIVKKLCNQAVSFLEDNGFDEERDCIHLVTHSWGTVILYDALIGNRWDNADLEHPVRKLRNRIRNLPPYALNGLQIASLHTLGSPVAVFSLLQSTNELQKVMASILNVDSRTQAAKMNELDLESSSFLKLTRKFGQFLHPERIGLVCVWKNYIHLADLVAHPLAPILDAKCNERDQVAPAWMRWFRFIFVSVIIALWTASVLQLLPSFVFVFSCLVLVAIWLVEFAWRTGHVHTESRGNHLHLEDMHHGFPFEIMVAITLLIPYLTLQFEWLEKLIPLETVDEAKTRILIGAGILAPPVSLLFIMLKKMLSAHLQYWGNPEVANGVVSSIIDAESLVIDTVSERAEKPLD